MRRRGAHSRTAAALIAVACAVIVAGCSSILAPTPDQSRYFVLTALAQPLDPPPPGANRLAIGVGPLQLPTYVYSRDDLVTLVGPNRLAYSNVDRWAEPLDKNFAQVMARDLSIRLGTSQVVQFPWTLPTRLDYTVTVALDHFERDNTGAVLLSGTWQIRDGNGKRILQAGAVHITEAAGDDPAGGLSRATAALTAQLADAIVRLHAGA